MRFIGVDLAWAEGARTNETGVVALDADGTIVDAGWTVGVDDTAAWIERFSTRDTLVFVDAPLAIHNASGQRRCENEVGRRYGRWKVSANSTNQGSPRKAGRALRAKLETTGWRYADGVDGPPRAGRHVSECYPYTAIVGAEEFGYDDERPTYKRKPRGMRVAQWRPIRADACDVLIQRMAGLASAAPALRLDSHPLTAELVDRPSPSSDREYKHREDLIDACIAAWTGALWAAHGDERCQVLGRDDDLGPTGAKATIIAPARKSQRVTPR